METINVYDFDKTIYDGDSTVNFYKYCILKYPKVLINLPNTIIGFIAYGLSLTDKTTAKQRFYRFLKFVPNIDSAVHGFWKLNSKKIKEWYIKQKKNDLIISASPDFLLEPICKSLNVDLIASIVDPKTGEYTGKNCYGEEKVLRFRHEYPSVQISEFYSDSRSDSPLASISDKAYLVRGDNVEKW